MTSELYDEQLRVTSIPYISSSIVVFNGVPLAPNSYKTSSGKYFVTIKIKVSAIPVKPAIGQHWSVKGLRVVEEVDKGDFLIQQHTYDSPKEVQCSLPESGEQLIRFIAHEKDFKGIGESKARALWQLLGKDFHETLKKDTPESRSSLRQILSDEAIDSLFTGYGKYRNLSFCNWMSKNNIPASIQQRLIKYHGGRTIHEIKLNPYVLVGFGMSFPTVDLLATNPDSDFSVPLSDDRRLSAAIEAAIRKEINKGHTYTSQ